jgi:hypothetical protein
MNETIEQLREDYESYKKGTKSVLSVKKSALSLLDVAQNKGDVEVVEEIKEMLLELEFSIDENKCNCHKGNSCC